MRTLIKLTRKPIQSEGEARVGVCDCHDAYSCMRLVSSAVRWAMGGVVDADRRAHVRGDPDQAGAARIGARAAGDANAAADDTSAIDNTIRNALLILSLRLQRKHERAVQHNMKFHK